jgi:hypothetical protein
MDERGPLFKGPETVVELPDVEPVALPELLVLDPQADTTTSSNDEVTARSRRVGCRVVTATP